MFVSKTDTELLRSQFEFLQSHSARGQYQEPGVKPRETRCGIRKGGNRRRAPPQDPGADSPAKPQCGPRELRTVADDRQCV